MYSGVSERAGVLYIYKRFPPFRNDAWVLKECELDPSDVKRGKIVYENTLETKWDISHKLPVYESESESDEDEDEEGTVTGLEHSLGKLKVGR